MYWLCRKTIFLQISQKYNQKYWHTENGYSCCTMLLKTCFTFKFQQAQHLKWINLQRHRVVFTIYPRSHAPSPETSACQLQNPCRHWWAAIFLIVHQASIKTESNSLLLFVATWGQYPNCSIWIFSCLNKGSKEYRKCSYFMSPYSQQHRGQLTCSESCFCMIRTCLLAIGAIRWSICPVKLKIIVKQCGPSTDNYLLEHCVPCLQNRSTGMCDRPSVYRISPQTSDLATKWCLCFCCCFERPSVPEGFEFSFVVNIVVLSNTL